MSGQGEHARRPDLYRIRQLNALDVGLRLGILNGPDASNRYRFGNYDGSYWLQFFDDGRWTGHKFDGLGGDAIALVQAYAAGAAHNFEIGSHNFQAALRWLAMQYNLWLSVEGPRRTSRALARTKEPDAWCYLTTLVQQIENNDYPPDAWNEVQKLCLALEIDPQHITLCPQPSKTSGTLCWQPVVPWQGVRISRKTPTTFGGWTKQRATTHMHTDGAMRLLVMDLDGLNAQNLKPSVALTDRLIQCLKQRHMFVAAHIWTSFDNKNDGRAKSHLYFKSSRPATSVVEYHQWWTMIDRTIRDIIDTRQLPDPREGQALYPDPATSKVSALVRLPGFSKFGSDWAGVVEFTSHETTDFDTLWETQVVQFVQGPRHYFFQKGLCYVEKQQPEQDAKTTVIGRNIWPLQIYQDDDGKVGARIRVEDLMGNTLYRTVCADSWVDSNQGKRAVGHLAASGVQISMGSQHALAYALGAWVESMGERVPRVKLTQLPGWHGESYLHGIEHMGASVIVADERAEPIIRRSARAGNVESWIQGANQLLTTPGLLTGLAQSLVGPLLYLIGHNVFGIHLWGASSSGKSTTAWVASSLWYDKPCDFNKTAKSIDYDAVAAHGACLVLDELGQADLRDDELSRFVYNITTGVQRGRLFRDGRAQTRLSWICSILTNGELSTALALGRSLKGGHAVRLIDLMVQPGECSENAEHARTIKQWATHNHGVVGGYWVKHLMTLDTTALKHDHEQLCLSLRHIYHPSPEDGRIIDNLATTMLAMKIATNTELATWLTPQKYDEWTHWLVERAVSNRGQANCPEGRTWRLILEMLQTNRYLFPIDAGEQRDKLWGVIAPDGESFYMTRQLLEQFDGPCAKNHTTATNFITWAIQHNHTDGRSMNVRRGRLKRRWIEFKLPTAPINATPQPTTVPPTQPTTPA